MLEQWNALTLAQKRKAYILAGAALAVVLAVLILLLVLPGGGDYQSHYERAESSFLHREYDAALYEVERALNLRQTEEAYLLWADVCYARGDLDQAIQVLYLGYGRVGGDAISNMLERLKVQNGDFSDSVVVGGQRLDRSATNAVLSGRNLTDEDLAPLAELTALETLSLADNAVSDLSALSGLVRLGSLQLSNNRIRDLSPLQNLSALKTLYLDGNPLEDLSPLYSLPQLRTLSLKGVALRREALDALRSALPDCRVFHDGMAGEPEDLSLGGLEFRSDVTELDLSGRHITDLTVLAKCGDLQRLDLHDNLIDDISMLTQLQKLEALNLRGNQVTDLMPLMSLTGLRELDVGGNRVEDLSALDYLGRLEDLSLDGNPVRRFDSLYRLDRLTRLDLRETGLEDEDLRALYGLSALRELALNGNPELSVPALEALQEALPDCTVAHDELRWKVRFGERTFYSDETVLLAAGLGVESLEGLERFENLTILDLDDNAVRDLRPLYGLEQLKVVLLRGNPVSLAEAAALQARLPDCLVLIDRSVEPTPTPPAAPTPTAVPQDPEGLAAGIAAALEAAGHGGGCALLWAEGDARAEAIRAGFLSNVGQLGLNLIAERPLPESAEALTAQLRSLRAAGAVVLVLALPEAQTELVAEAAAAIDYAPQMLIVY